MSADIEDSNVALGVTADVDRGVLRFEATFVDDQDPKTGARVVLDVDPVEVVAFVDKIITSLGELGVTISPKDAR